ncbi:helix-turn-helix domain-containing protein [Domibacillus robiginosus]|uniref:helix-turn-helix domain-containing protein n=1 Tax=Domibacillus robiginosus TaxID=1071054 RepID=UPI00067C166B|nr:helix-turn-helix transcriptional regulator [Domibacillus robiginosus]
MGIRAERTEQLLVKTSKPAPRQKFSEEEKAFIQHLVCERKKRKLTQGGLAKIIGADQAAIARLETMRVNPTLKTIINILDAMDMQLVIVEKE